MLVAASAAGSFNRHYPCFSTVPPHNPTTTLKGTVEREQEFNMTMFRVVDRAIRRRRRAAIGQQRDQLGSVISLLMLLI
jgi:hypothetical protein